ncbi:hypothetical protein ACOMHN_061926 [Nucella lapillus]
MDLPSLEKKQRGAGSDSTAVLKTPTEDTCPGWGALSKGAAIAVPELCWPVFQPGTCTYRPFPPCADPGECQADNARSAFRPCLLPPIAGLPMWPSL